MYRYFEGAAFKSNCTPLLVKAARASQNLTSIPGLFDLNTELPEPQRAFRLPSWRQPPLYTSTLCNSHCVPYSNCTAVCATTPRPIFNASTIPIAKQFSAKTLLPITEWIISRSSVEGTKNDRRSRLCTTCHYSAAVRNWNYITVKTPCLPYIVVIRT
jgi:hypothetical protein